MLLEYDMKSVAGDTYEMSNVRAAGLHAFHMLLKYGSGTLNHFSVMLVKYRNPI